MSVLFGRLFRCHQQSLRLPLGRELFWQDIPEGVDYEDPWKEQVCMFGSMVRVAGRSRLCNLSEFPADFVVLSFYKIFGFPTGLGALLVRKSSAPILHKIYYGGGSVLQTVTSTGDHRLPSDLARRFEDGTPNFLGISSLRFGFESLREVGGLSAIERHTEHVRSYL